jgi:tetratricopeptide (TPR) repeat protein
VLWADALELGEAGWFDLRDLVVRRIVLRLFASVEEAGLRRGLRRPDGHLTAFEHLARGKALFRSFEPGVNERAAAHFQAAIEADPALGVAHSYLGLAELALHDYGLAPHDVKRLAAGRAALGVELSPDESRCHGILAYMLTLLGEVAAAEREALLAIELNPCDPDGPFELALVLAWSGRSAEALPWLERAKALNPLWPAHTTPSCPRSCCSSAVPPNRRPCSAACRG